MIGKIQYAIRVRFAKSIDLFDNVTDSVIKVLGTDLVSCRNFSGQGSIGIFKKRFQRPVNLRRRLSGLQKKGDNILARSDIPEDLFERLPTHLTLPGGHHQKKPGHRESDLTSLWRSFED